MNNLARLLQLASPTLPVGAYSYSQGLEAAVEAGIVTDAASAERWIADVLELSVGRMELAVLRRQLEEPAQETNDLFLAARETAELRAETVQMGHSLQKLLAELGVDVPIEQPAFPTAYACAARAWGLGERDAVVAYLWSWLENQVMAAVKAVPLGQTAGQKILLALGARLEALAQAEPRWSNLAPGLAFLSARHETQYSRLFRS
ncbi:MAG TPA: urease accessory protein UreF [Burkholderiales bacterium]|nr:urease accessory protein UreF [Burkholderiales bacterium]